MFATRKLEVQLACKRFTFDEGEPETTVLAQHSPFAKVWSKRGRNGYLFLADVQIPRECWWSINVGNGIEQRAAYIVANQVVRKDGTERLTDQNVYTFSYSGQLCAVKAWHRTGRPNAPIVAGCHEQFNGEPVRIHQVLTPAFDATEDFGNA